jgi:hypothetical protein
MVDLSPSLPLAPLTFAEPVKVVAVPLEATFCSSVVMTCVVIREQLSEVHTRADFLYLHQRSSIITSATQLALSGVKVGALA